MKVLQVIDQLGVGGAERVVIDLSNILHNNSINVSFLVLLRKTNQDILLNKNIPKFYLKRKSKFSVKYLFRLSKILKNYDIIHVHMRHTFRYVQLASKLFGINSKVILHDHSSKTNIEFNVPFLLNSFLKPKYYISVSNELTNWCKNKLKLNNSNNIFLLSNIVVKQIVNEPVNRNGWVVVGNIKPSKNQLFAVNLAAKCNKKLTIIGKIQDQKYYDRITEVIKVNKQEQKINFIHNENNTQQLMNQFELGLMTSTSESGPLVLIEYLAQSLPFMSYNTGEVSSILSNNIPEFFINSFDLALWKSKIDNLPENKIDFDSLYNTYFSPENYSKKCIAIYEKILKDS